VASTQDRLNGKGEYNGTDVCWREDGKQRSRRFPSSAEAEAYRRKIECGTADVSPAARAARPFGDYVLNMWLPNAGLAPSTGRAVRSAMNNDLAPLADKTVAWVAQNRAEVQATIAASRRSDHGLLYMVVKCACDEAVNMGMIDPHRLSGIKVKRNQNRRDIIPTTREQREYIAAGLGKRSLVVYLMHGTGMRIGEVLGLRGSDFRDGFSTVRLQRKADKGTAGPLKHRKPGQFRDVPVPAWLAKMVKAYVSEHGLGALFPGARDKEFCSYESVGTTVTKRAAEVGLKGFSCHQFRHAFATTLLTEGMGIMEVAEWMGDGVKIVQETYAHVLPVASDNARRILDAAL
jgi:integrase